MALRVVEWICRLLLAALFLVAGYIKLRSPFLFEMQVDTYQLLPPWAVIFVARTLPWAEVAIGVLLLLGWKIRYTSSFTALLLGGFLVAMGITYSRGIQANCGCFGAEEKIGPLTFARDSGLFAMAVFLAVYSWRRRSSSSFQPNPQTAPVGSPAPNVDTSE